MAQREVSMDEFWLALYDDKRNIHPTPEGPWPYTSVFRTQDNNRTEFGRIVESLTDGRYPIVTRYYLAGQ